MDKIFKFLNDLAKNKYFKIFLALVILGTLFYINFDKKYIDFEKAEKVIAKLFPKSNKNMTENVSKNMEEMPIEEEKEFDLSRKEIVPDREVKKDLKKEEELGKITNVLLKIKKMDETYTKKEKSGKIDKSRRVKYGDFIYYSMEATYSTDDTKKPTNRFFMQIQKDDFLSEKLLGKKIGQWVEFSYTDMLNNVQLDEREEIEGNLEKTIEIINEKYGRDGVPIFKNNRLTYRIKVLDFLTEQQLRELLPDSD